MPGSRGAANRAAVAGSGHAEGADGDELATTLGGRCAQFLRPLLQQLDRQLDVRLVRTLAAGVTAVVRHRHRPLALLLSELGACLAGPTHAPAGTKRLANLIHSSRWQAPVIDAWLLAEGRAQVAAEAARVPEGRAPSSSMAVCWRSRRAPGLRDLPRCGPARHAG